MDRYPSTDDLTYPHPASYKVGFLDGWMDVPVANGWMFLMWMDDLSPPTFCRRLRLAHLSKVSLLDQWLLYGCWMTCWMNYKSMYLGWWMIGVCPHSGRRRRLGAPITNIGWILLWCGSCPHSFAGFTLLGRSNWSNEFHFKISRD